MTINGNLCHLADVTMPYVKGVPGGTPRRSRVTMLINDSGCDGS